MNIKRLFIAGFIVAVMGLLMTGCLFGDPSDPSKTVSPSDGANFQYIIDREKVTVTKYHGVAKEVTVPSTIEGFPVTAIGEHCFENTNITSLNIPSSVKQLGDYMCYNASNLKRITFEDETQIVTIGKSIITNTALESNIDEGGYYLISGMLVRVNPNYSGEYVLPDSIYVAASGAFENSQAKKITFGENYSTIFASDLSTMPNLECIEVKSLKTVVEPSPMFKKEAQYIICNENESVIDYAKTYGYFYTVKTDEKWDYSEENGKLTIEKYHGSSVNVMIPSKLNGKNVYGLAKDVFDENVQKIYVPKTVKYIANGFLEDCTGFETAVFENATTLDYIGAYAFRNTKFELESNRKNDMSVIGGILVRHFGTGEITVDKSIRSVSGRAFGEGVIGITFSEGVTEFEDNMLIDCNDIEYIYIPNSMSEININAFSGREALLIRCDAVSAAATFAADNKFEFEAIYFWTYELDETNKTVKLLQYTGDQENVIVPASVREYKVIALGSIRNTAAKTLYIPKCVTSIDEMFAYSLTSLESVTFEDASTIEFIGGRAFYQTKYEQNQQSRNNGMLVIGKILVSSNATGNVVVPQGVEIIAPMAFYESSAESIVLSDECKTINSWAFRSCAQLKTVYIKDLVNSVGDNILDDSKNATVLCHSNTFIESFARLMGISYKLVQYDEWQYAEYEDGYKVTKYVGSNKKVLVPASINGIKVLAIGKECFVGTKITEVKIPSSIKTIEDRAFYNNGLLDTVTFENVSNLKYIGDYVFYGTEYFETLPIDSETQSFILNNTLIKCVAQGAYTLPKNVQYIAGGAFFNGLTTDIVINEACRRIGNMSLGSENSLKALSTIYIPDGVTDIANGALGFATNVIIYCHENSVAATYAKANSISYVQKKNDYFFEEIKSTNTIRLIRYIGSEKEISVPRYLNGKPVSTIASGCYADSFVENIYIHDGITTIEAKAFSADLTTVAFEDPSTIVKIYDNAFAGTAFWNSSNGDYTMIGGILIKCMAEGDVKIPTNTEKIAGGAFAESPARTISIQHSDIVIEDYAFRDCTAEWVFITKNVSEIGKDILKDSDAYIRCVAGSFAEQYAVMNDYAVVVDSENYDWEYIIGSNGITLTRYDGESTDVVIPAVIAGLNVIEIEDNCFDGSNITSVFIPKTVKTLGNEAFARTPYLTMLSFEDVTTLNELGYGVFEGSAVLESLYDENGFAIINRILIAYKGSGDVVLYDDIQRIAGKAFAGNTEVTSIRINEICRSIGYAAFADMTALELMYIPDSVFEFAGEVFTNFNFTVECTADSNAYEYVANRGVTVNVLDCKFEYTEDENGVTITGYKGKDKRVIIPALLGKSTVVAIGEEAFRGLDIENVYIPSTVTTLGNMCFAYCVNLAEVVFEDESNVTNIGNMTFRETYFENISGVDERNMIVINHILIRHFGTGSITLPEGIEGIAGGAFIGNSDITGITIANGCKFIDSNAFSRLTSLMYVSIPKTVKFIDDNILVGCNESVYFICETGSYAEQFAQANGIPCNQ